MKYCSYIYSLSKKCFALVLILFLFSCENELSQETLNKITELENILAEAEDNLAYDENELSQRLDSMNIKLEYIKTHKPDSGNDEMKNALTRYKAISSNYKAFLQEMPVATYDLEIYKTDFEKLKNDVLHHEIPEKEFDEQYSVVKRKYMSLEIKTRALAYKTFSIEGEFMRNDAIITNLYQNLKNSKQ